MQRFQWVILKIHKIIYIGGLHIYLFISICTLQKLDVILDFCTCFIQIKSLETLISAQKTL